MSLDNFEKMQKFISDDSDYEAQFAYGKEIFDDFNYNVGRKMHVIKSTIKVQIMLIFTDSHNSVGMVLSHWLCELSWKETIRPGQEYTADGDCSELLTRLSISDLTRNVQTDNF